MTTQEAAARYLKEHLDAHPDKTPIVFNPHSKSVEELPHIMCFSNSRTWSGAACAIAQDGHVLGSHFCSHEGYVPSDLGVYKGWMDDRHDTYRKHYPDGYQMRFIEIAKVGTDEMLNEALAKNRELAKTSELEAE